MQIRKLCKFSSLYFYVLKYYSLEISSITNFLSNRLKTHIQVVLILPWLLPWFSRFSPGRWHSIACIRMKYFTRLLIRDCGTKTVSRISFVKCRLQRGGQRDSYRSSFLFSSPALLNSFSKRRSSRYRVFADRHRRRLRRSHLREIPSSPDSSNQRISFYLMHFKYSDGRFVVAIVVGW